MISLHPEHIHPNQHNRLEPKDDCQPDSTIPDTSDDPEPEQEPNHTALEISAISRHDAVNPTVPLRGTPQVAETTDREKVINDSEIDMLPATHDITIARIPKRCRLRMLMPRRPETFDKHPLGLQNPSCLKGRGVEEAQ